jgi:hypothetical protein
MENEPDDSQDLVKLLMYANEVDVEGLIAVTSRPLMNDVFPESSALPNKRSDSQVITHLHMRILWYVETI